MRKNGMRNGMSTRCCAGTSVWGMRKAGTGGLYKDESLDSDTRWACVRGVKNRAKIYTFERVERVNVLPGCHA